MSSIVERLVRDFVDAALPATVRRDARPHMLERKADVFVGMRRSGKTFAMFDTMRRLVDAGMTPRRNMMYFNVDDDRLPAPSVEMLDSVLETFFRLSPEARDSGACLFFDEIQVVPGWERFARRVLDTERAHLFVGGSSSKLLSAEVATSFRGRSLTVEVLPYGLREFARAIGVDGKDEAGAAGRSRMAALADRYLIEGGFPETVGMSDLARAQTLQGYVELVVLRDVVERHGVENVVVLRRLIRGAFAANAGPFAITSFEGVLRSQGLRTTKGTLLAYLDHLTDAYLFFLVPIDSRSEKARVVNPRKVYAADPGLAAAMYPGGALNRGALLETAVYLELRRRLGPIGASAIAYHRTEGGREVDFVVDSPVPGVSRHFVQVCADLTGDATAERETAAITEALIANEGSTGVVVTTAERGEVSTPVGPVEVVPFWEWALRER